MPVIDEITGETLEGKGNEFLQDPTLKVSQSSCSLRFQMTCAGRPPQAAYNKQLTGSRDVFEDGAGQRLGKQSFIKDLRHLLCPTCLQYCTQCSDTMYSRILPGDPRFVLLPPRMSLDLTLQPILLSSRTTKGSNWKRSLRHKQRLGVLDDVGVEVLALYRSRADNISSAFSKTLDVRLITLPAEQREKFDAALRVIEQTLSDMRECPANDYKAAISAPANDGAKQAVKDTPAPRVSAPQMRTKRARQAVPRPVLGMAMMQAEGPGTFNTSQLSGFMAAQDQIWPSRMNKGALVSAVQESLAVNQGMQSR